jgi:hypothetical protein
MIDDNVRKMIREVLAEELRRAKAEVHGAAAPRHEVVSIKSDADLAEFVARLMKLASDGKTRGDIEQGRLVFRLGGQQPSSDPAGSAPAARLASPVTGGTVRLDRGVVSERKVDGLPKGTRILQIASGVKLTPLAKDRLRQRGIKIERTG